MRTNIYGPFVVPKHLRHQGKLSLCSNPGTLLSFLVFPLGGARIVGFVVKKKKREH